MISRHARCTCGEIVRRRLAQISLFFPSCTSRTRVVRGSNFFSNRNVCCFISACLINYGRVRIGNFRVRGARIVARFTEGTELLPKRRKRLIVPNRVIRSIAESCRGLFFRRDIECRQIIMTTTSRITKRVYLLVGTSVRTQFVLCLNTDEILTRVE